MTAPGDDPPAPPAHAGSDRHVLVTGAGKGIGRAIVRRLVRDGARVLALSRSAADLDTLAAETGCATVTVDLSDPVATRSAAQHLVDAASVPFTGLVNCAGIALLAPFVQADADDFQRTMNVNCLAPMLLAQPLARRWIADDRPGAIVNVSSIAAGVGTPDHAIYGASKGALDALTRTMAVELGPHGIRVNAINPTITLTPMARQAWADPARSARMLARIPMQRFIEPDEIAGVVAFLLGPDAAMVHGECINVDGGFRAG